MSIRSGQLGSAQLGLAQLGVFNAGQSGVSPGGIASAEAFGTAKITLYLLPGGIGTAEAFGNPVVHATNTIQPSGIASAEAFGTLKLTLYILPSGIASAEAFGSLSVAPRNSILPSGIGTAEAFGTPLLHATSKILPSGIASAEAFGTADVVGPVEPGGIASAEAFGTPRIVGPIKPSGIPSAEAFGTADVVGPVIPTGIASKEAFGKPDVAGPVIASGIPSAEAFGRPSFDVEQAIAPTGIPSGEAVSTGAIVRHVMSILPSGIGTAEAFGSPIVAAGPQLIAGAGAIEPGIMGIPSLAGGDQVTHLYIAGVDRGAYLLAKGGTNPVSSSSGSGASAQVPIIQSQTIGRWKCSFDLYPQGSGYLPALGQTVQYIENGKKLFAGCLNSVVIELISGGSDVILHCDCVDKSGILDHRVIKNKTYPAGMDAAAAIRDIVTNWLNGEGITTNNVPQSLGALSADQIFYFSTVTKALDAIMQDVAGVWWVDVNGDLHTPLLPNLPAAPFSLTATSGNFRSLTVQATLLDYRNVQYAVSNLKVAFGSAGPSGPQGVSVTETYTLPQPAAVARGFLFGAIITNFNMISVTSLKVNGVSQPVYKGTMQINFRHVWWFFPGSPYLTPPNAQNTNTYPNPPVTSPDPQTGDVVEIVYVADVQNAAVTSRDPLSPPGPGTGTCGSGVYEAVEQVKNVSLQTDLQAIAAAVLTRSGGVPKLLQFDTDEPGLQVGMKLSVDLPAVDLAASTLLITRVYGASQPGKANYASSDPRTQTNYRWTIQASTTTDLGNEVKYMERLIARTENAIPLDQLLWPTFILAPSGSLGAGTVSTNPEIIRKSGQVTEVVAAAAAPPTGQDLVLDFISVTTGLSILSAPLVIPNGTPANQLVTTTALANDPAPTYLYQNDVLRVVSSYKVRTTGVVTPAAQVTVQVRMTF